MDEFCGSDFWDSELTWNTNSPYFTPCFESLFWSLLPFYFLLIFGITDVFNIHNSKFKKKNIKATFRIITTGKFLLTLSLILLNFIQIIRCLVEVQQGSLHTVDYLIPSLEILAYIIILIFPVLTHYAMVASSGVQFLFWLISLIAQVILFRTAYGRYDGSVQNDKYQIVYLTRFIEFPIICVRFILEWFPDTVFEDNIKWGKASPEKTSTFVSKILFLWYDQFAWNGYRRPLTSEDLWDVNENDRSKVQSDLFEELWTKEKFKAQKRTKNTGKKSQPGIVGPLLRAYGITFGFGLSLKIFADLLAFLQPLMLRYLVAHISNPEDEPGWKGYLYTGVICFAAIIQSVLNGFNGKKAHLTAMHVRTALSNAVFRKALVISNSSKRETSGGEIVNLMSVDTQRFMELLPMISITIGGPVQIILSIALLYNVLGPSVFAGVGVLIALIPLNTYVIGLARSYQMQQMKLKDERLKLTSEVLAGIKVLKLYAWELAYEAKIETIRNAELVFLRKISHLNVVTGFIFQCTPIFVSLVSFVSFVLSDPTNNILNAERAFVSISLFAIMRFPMILLPLAFATGMQSAVSIQRLNKFLNMEELDRNAVTHNPSETYPVVLENATLSWTEQMVTLRDINLRVGKGELVAIVGPIGCGKTSLLASLLGDLSKNSGRINTTGQVAYVSQSAWIQNATVRDNILFGDKYNEGKYKKVIAACALETDFQILSFGDQTEIGEKGMNLSGGQKQRVSLARAAYKEAEIYLFDDPLSAVDSHVGKHIFDNLIGPNGILKNKTRLLVTHGISYVPRVDRIVVMRDGCITETGTYKELLKKRGEFAEFLLHHIGVDEDVNIDGESASLIQDLEEVIGAEAVQRHSSANRESIVKLFQKNLSKEANTRQQQLETGTGTPKKMIVEEAAGEGNISIDVITQYILAAGIIASCTGIGGAAASNVIIAFSNVWLSNWATQATIDEVEVGANIQETTNKYLLGYGLITASLGFSTVIGGIGLNRMCLMAGQVFHSKALKRVMRSPMSYFDTTLLGRLLNRFSKDVDTLDNLNMNFRTFLFMGFNVLATFGIMIYTSPILLSLIIPVIIIYFFIQRFYSATSRQLKRLDGVTRSPIFSHFQEAVSGSSIIRAFGLEDEFITESEKRIDLNQKAYFPFAYSSIWMGIRLEFIGVLIVLATCSFTLINRKTIQPGVAGLVLSYSIQITMLLSLLSRQTSDLEANIVSAERLGELTVTPQEPLWEIEETKPKPDWPENGELQFSNYMTRYRKGLDLVLKGITCTVYAGEKIGVVGRTGAGKSSLTLALFRLIESSDGKILIDGIDISKLGLHQLRKKITIIPQDPVLFSGTLRSNLDPFNQYSDDQLWKCLELAHLKTYARSLPEGLIYIVDEEGKNFSVGQRQLLCLARALLRKTKILVLDEATAAVDLETDDLIQATIRHEFADSTIITIAHRLNTIMDSNRVLVLDQGEIREFDSPTKLLQDSATLFWGMAHDAKLV